jgi:O-acetyl-ADP-ribose deacetylase (regulator of RNase III)
LTAQILKRLGAEYARFVEDVEEANTTLTSQVQTTEKTIESIHWSCEKTILGHEGNVTCVCFSPDGKVIVSSSDDNTVRLWDLQGNQIGQPFQGHQDSVWSVAFSPDGKVIVSSSDDNTLRLWDLQGNQIGQPFQGHQDSVWSVAFSPDGRVIVSGGAEVTLRLWDLGGNQIGQPFLGHGSWVNSVAFSGDGKAIVSGSGDNTVLLWDLQGNQIGQPFQGHQDKVRSVAFSPDTQAIVSGSRDNTLRLWDLQGNQIGQPFLGHESWVNSVAFSPDGRIIASAGMDKTVCLWDLQGNLISNPLEGHESRVNSVAFSPDGQILVSCSEDKSIKFWIKQKKSLEDELRAALTIDNKQKQSEMLANLMARSPEIPPKLLQIISTIESESIRISSLITLIPNLPSTLLSNALEIVQRIQDSFIRFQGLAILAVLLPEIVPEALQTSLAIEDESIRLEAVASVVEKLPSELLPQALEAVLTVNGAFSRARALIILINKLPDAIPQVLSAIIDIKDDYSRAKALEELVSHLHDDLLPNVLEAISKIQQEGTHNKVLRDLRHLLAEKLKQTQLSNRTLLLKQGNTSIYSLCIDTPWNLPYNALVIPIGNGGGLGNLGRAFQSSFAEKLETSDKWLFNAIAEAMTVNKLKRIKPEQPLFMKLPSMINTRISDLSGFNLKRFIICATSESEDEMSSNNTAMAYEAIVRLAIEQKFKQVLFPLIGTGVNQLPVDEVATGMLRAIDDSLKVHEFTSLEEITIVDRDLAKIEKISNIARHFPLSVSPVTSNILDEDGFLTQYGIQDLVQNSQNLESSENILKVMLVFQTQKQKTWLVSTNKQVFFLLDDKKRRSSQQIIQYRQALKDSLPVTTRKESDLSGSFQLGSSAFWYYSLDILGNPEESRLRLERFVNTAIKSII